MRRKNGENFTLRCRFIPVLGHYGQVFFIQGGQKRVHFVSWVVTSEVLTTAAPNLAQINVISFLTLPRNLLETTLENKVAPFIES